MSRVRERGPLPPDLGRQFGRGGDDTAPPPREVDVELDRTAAHIADGRTGGFGEKLRRRVRSIG